MQSIQCKTFWTYQKGVLTMSAANPAHPGHGRQRRVRPRELVRARGQRLPVLWWRQAVGVGGVQVRSVHSPQMAQKTKELIQACSLTYSDSNFALKRIILY